MILAVEARKTQDTLAVGNGDGIGRGCRQQQLAYRLGGIGIETLTHEGDRLAREVERLVGLPSAGVVGRARERSPIIVSTNMAMMATSATHGETSS